VSEEEGGASGTFLMTLHSAMALVVAVLVSLGLFSDIMHVLTPTSGSRSPWLRIG
jgi:hypothetical protein